MARSSMAPTRRLSDAVSSGTAADIEFGPTGELFVADGLDAMWVVEFAEDGTVTSLETLATFPERPVALAFDPSGTLFVGTDNSIWMIEPREAPSVFTGGLDGEEGLAFDSSGSLYVSNVATNQILRKPNPVLLPVEVVRLEGGAFFERATIGDSLRLREGTPPYSSTPKARTALSMASRRLLKETAAISRKPVAICW